LRAGETIYVEDVSQLPPEAWREKDLMEKHHAGRLCAFPIHADAQLVGFLACHSYSAARLGPENERRVLETVVAMIGSALYRATVLETLEQRVADRTQELSTLYRVTSLTSAPLPLVKTLARALDAVLAALDSPAGAIHLREGSEAVLRLVAHQGLPPEAVAELEATLPEEVGWNWVLAHDRPLLLLKDLCAEPQLLPLTCVAGFQAYLGVPVHVEGEPGGVLSVFDTAAEGFTTEDMALLTTIADQLGTAVESDRLRGKAEEVRVVQERQRLARDLHDAVSQSLYSLTLFSEAAQEVFQGGKSDQTHQYLEQIKQTAHQALKEMRLLIYQLRPAALATEGLAGAAKRRLEAVERRAGMEALLITHNGDLELPPPLEDTLYRLAQEALNNVLKHAEASQVTVDLSVDDGWVELVVGDNGRGFDPGAPPDLGGMGLANMRQRVEEVGGTLEIASTPGQGTRVKVRTKATGSPSSEEVSG
jgi:signal transduction histidine kinase